MNDSTFNTSSSSSKQPQIVEMVMQMFQEAGVKEHEPQVVLQLTDLAYSLTKEVLLDAKTLSEFVQKKQLDKQDIEYTIKSFQEKHKSARAPKDVLHELAAQKNTQPLQPLRQNFGLRLPNDRFCQVQPNYEFIAPCDSDAMHNGNGDMPMPAKRRPPCADRQAVQFSTENVSSMLDAQMTIQNPTNVRKYEMPMEEDFD